MKVKARRRLAAAGLACMLALGVAACEVENGEAENGIDDPLEEEDDL